MILFLMLILRCKYCLSSLKDHTQHLPRIGVLFLFRGGEFRIGQHQRMQPLYIVTLFIPAPVVHQVEVHPAPVLHLLIFFSSHLPCAAIDLISPPAVLGSYGGDRLISE